MDKIAAAVLTALVCIPLTALITRIVCLYRSGRSESLPFRAVYIKRESALDFEDLKHYHGLEPHLEQAGLRLLPNASLREVACVKEGLSQSDSISAFLQIDGRTIQFLLVGAQKLNPLAVVYVGGNGSQSQGPAVLREGVEFTGALFESINLPEIVILDQDMKDPIHVVRRIQEIVQKGKAGVINV